MRENQWYIFTAVFFALFILFGILYNPFIPATYIFFPAEWICFALAFGCLIAGLLEGHTQKRLQEEKSNEKMMIDYVKEKVGLNGNPKNREELLDLAKKVNKTAKVLSEIEYWYRKGKKETENIALFYSLSIADKIGLKKKPKSPEDLFRLARKKGKFEEAVKLLSYLERGQTKKFVNYKNKEANKITKTKKGE